MNDKIKYDSNAMQTMRYFEKITSARLKDTFEVDGLQVFVVQPSQIGKAVGKQGANVKKLAQALKKNIKIIEYSPDLKVFIKNTTFPLIPEKVVVDEDENIATIIPKDILSRGLLIGRQAIKLRETEKIVKRYFDLNELRVGKPSELTSDVQAVVSEGEKKTDKLSGEIDSKLEEIEGSAEKKDEKVLKKEDADDEEAGNEASAGKPEPEKVSKEPINPEDLAKEAKIEEDSKEETNDNSDEIEEDRSDEDIKEEPKEEFKEESDEDSKNSEENSKEDSEEKNEKDKEEKNSNL